MEGVAFWRTSSEDETKRCGEEFTRRFLETPFLALLAGELGVGKTVFVKGMAQALGIRENVVRSPTFSLIHEYPGSPFPLYHMDFYRLNRWEDVIDLGFEEYLEGDGVVAIEWGDKFLSHIPPPLFVVYITAVDERTRDIHIVFSGDEA